MQGDDDSEISDAASLDTIDATAIAEAAKVAIEQASAAVENQNNAADETQVTDNITQNIHDSVISESPVVAPEPTPSTPEPTLSAPESTPSTPEPTPSTLESVMMGTAAQPAGQPVVQPMVGAQTVILGNVQQQMGVNPYGQVLMVGPPSSAAKVMGIFIIIWGVFGAFDGIFSVLSESHFGTFYLFLMVVSTLTGAGIIFAGVQVLNFQKKGIHLAWVLIGIGMVVSIISMSMLPDLTIQMVEDGDMTQEEADILAGAGGLVAGIGIGISVICSAICGVLVAIPLMVANNGLDNSSLFGKKEEKQYSGY
ncbi:MAG: hypothetical protein CXT69_06515 [Methanobacteriota archaeon]|nr:MAG: hypothetical protein CXT69_06515 [Euryarchaeota archaeon]